MKILRRTLFGNPLLRQVTRQLSSDEIKSEEIQQLIQNMYFTLQKKKYGVGLAAPQVGKSVAITVIGIKPTPTRPDNPTLEMTVINPVIIKTYGTKVPMWEACISMDGLAYALVPRYKKLKLRYSDEDAKVYEENFDGIVAHVIQHEVDHLNGILYVDRVEDTTSYMAQSEYLKMRKRELLDKT